MAKLEINPLNIARLKVEVEGASPLISHKFSEKAKRQMLATQQKTAKAGKKEVRVPEADFVGSLYWVPASSEPHRSEVNADTVGDFIEGGTFGLLATSFKQALVQACRQVDGLAMTAAKQMFFTTGEAENGEVCVIRGDKPWCREDIARNDNGNPDLRFRGQFDEWATTFFIEYNSDVISMEQLVNLINVAGWASGLGDWRPQKGGNNGRFVVKSVTQVEGPSFGIGAKTTKKKGRKATAAT